MHSYVCVYAGFMIYTRYLLMFVCMGICVYGHFCKLVVGLCECNLALSSVCVCV